MFAFTAHIKPVSVNQAVRHGKRGSYKSDALKKFWIEINRELSRYEAKEFPEAPLYMKIDFTIPKEEFFIKTGRVAKKHDLDNLQKYTIDAISKYLGFNDSLICELATSKKPGSEWSISAFVGVM